MGTYYIAIMSNVYVGIYIIDTHIYSQLLSQITVGQTEVTAAQSVYHHSAIITCKLDV